MIEFNQNNDNVPSQLSYLLNYFSILNQTSNLIPIIIYPVKECCDNWVNVAMKEYPLRSSIRAIVTTTSFAAGPLLIEFANFTWLADRSTGLYRMIPVINLLPEKAGTYLCSAYLCGYFATWAIHQMTNLYTKFKFGGTEHYLTATKTSEVHEKMISNNFNITQLELQKIFTDINQQWRNHPQEQHLLKMLHSIRHGDLQSVIDNANLLEAQIAILEHKLAIMQQHLNPLNYNVISYSGNLSENSSELNDPNVTEITEEPTTLPINEIDRDISVSDNDLNLPSGFTPAGNIEIPNIRSLPHNIRHINPPPISAILNQYPSKHKGQTRDNNTTKVINKLKQHKQQLIEKRYINPDKSYVAHP